MMTIGTTGKKLRAARERAGLSQGDLAEAAWGERARQSEISRIEAGKEIVLGTLRRLAEVLGVDPGTLI